MEYLTRKGKLQLQFSERHGAGFVPYNELPDWARRWGEQAGNYIDGQQVGDAEQHMTSHIVFSLPNGTDENAAYRAMRNAAEDVFGATIIREGDRGNTHEFDYLTAFHTDKPHPHLHVIVNRRSLQRDPDTKKHEWLKIARRNTRINYAIMREKFAYRAQQEGIDVEATSRLERGIETPSLTNEQFRINARRAVEVREQWDNLTVIAVDPASPSRSPTPEPVAGPSTQRPQGAGSASGQTGGGTGGGGNLRPDIATSGNGSTHSRHHDNVHQALEADAAATARPSSTGTGVEPTNNPAQDEANPGTSGGGSESHNNVIDAHRSRDAERQRRERTKRHHATRELEDPEGDRLRRRIPENSSLSPEQEDVQSVAPPRENDSARHADLSPPPAASEDRPEAPDNSPLEQFQVTFRVTPDGGGGGPSGNAAELPDETAAQAAARSAAASARRRGDDLDRVVRTRGQKRAEEAQRIEDGPISGRLRSSTRPPPDRTR
jgi:type IV secretion system T-DNA border endonuclease VirD2